MYLVVQKDPAPAGEGVPRGAEWGNDLTDDDLTLTPRTYPQRSFLVNNFFSGRTSALFSCSIRAMEILSGAAGSRSGVLSRAYARRLVRGLNVSAAQSCNI